ncbi:UNVERIFIED_CONTAM: hypothetical protein Sangu_1644700 [Sesamum angustifolium]|uniref:Uncharacterized protein n=1 Tax=Sesamum angustifolium TaxID=2727405 RepID=A0AAW2MHM3_9LAMI
MNPTKALIRTPMPLFRIETRRLDPNIRWAFHFHSKFHGFVRTRSSSDRLPVAPTSLPAIASDVSPGLSHSPKQEQLEKIEVNIEKVIYGAGSLPFLRFGDHWSGLSFVSSRLSCSCFQRAVVNGDVNLFKGQMFLDMILNQFSHIGCVYVVSAFQEYFLDRGKVIASLVEATDVYLLGTVMLVFGMGLYELFISNLDKGKSMSNGRSTYRSNLFGLFTLKERPRWLEIKTVNELKTKLGHVIVMLLLIGLFDKSKKAVIQSPVDLLCFSASVLLSSGCLFLLSKLNE